MGSCGWRTWGRFHLSVTADAVPPPLKGRLPWRGAVSEADREVFRKYQKTKELLPKAEVNFKGIRPENPDWLPGLSGIPHRLPRSTGTAVPDGKYDIRMVYHIPVPLSQTIRRVLPL